MASAPISDGSSRILTVPNLLTLVRALGIPLFLWLFLVQHDAAWSFVVLALGAMTDYFDGKIARALDQVSSLGAAMDPSIDRIYIASTVIALAMRNFIPWWMVIVLALRDLWMVVALIVKRKRTGQVFEVTYLGKAATFNLLYAFPFLLLSAKGFFGEVMHIFGWSFALWGTGLYLLTAVQYSSDAFKKFS
jgi:cardiolipin synthase